MDIFKYAKKMELDGKVLYEKELAKTTDLGIRSILKRLIEAEDNHYTIFVALEKKESADSVKVMDFSDSRNVFEEFIDEGKTNFPKENILFFELALDIEEKSEKFYREHAKNLPDKKVQKIVLQIADEEHKHVVLMYNIVRYVKKGMEWVEDAEFHRMED